MINNDSPVSLFDKIKMAMLHSREKVAYSHHLSYFANVNANTALKSKRLKIFPTIVTTWNPMFHKILLSVVFMVLLKMLIRNAQQGK